MKVLSEEAIADLSKTLDLVKAGRAKAAKSCQCPHCGPDRDYECAIDDMVEEIDTLSDAVLALNAVRALGEARVKMRAQNSSMPNGFAAWVSASNEGSEAARQLETLADKLVKGGE